MSFSMSKNMDHFKFTYRPKECLFLWVRDWIISSFLSTKGMSFSTSKRLTHFKSSYQPKE